MTMTGMNPLKAKVRKILLRAFSKIKIDAKIAYACMLTPTALRRIVARGIPIRSVIDIGASDGRWSVEAREFWPQARFHLIEANPYHQPGLDALVKRNAAFSYVLAAAGDRVGRVSFDASDPFSGTAGLDPNSREGLIEVSMTSIDHEVTAQHLPAPYLIKLDTHGFEVPILQGAKETLREAELVVLETYNFPVAPNSLMFYEMCAFMQTLGFRVIDISEPVWRTKDKAFWQMDFFFIKKSRHEFDCTSYT